MKDDSFCRRQIVQEQEFYGGTKEGVDETVGISSKIKVGFFKTRWQNQGSLETGQCVKYLYDRCSVLTVKSPDGRALKYLLYIQGIWNFLVQPKINICFSFPGKGPIGWRDSTAEITYNGDGYVTDVDLEIFRQVTPKKCFWVC